MISEKKFLELSLKQRHKQAAKLLRSIATTPKAFSSKLFKEYRTFEKHLSLPPIEETFEALSNRFHTHLMHAEISLKEHLLLPKVTHFDRLFSDAPFLPLVIYLDHLRSSHNVGSIIRTVEAFRLGTVVFSKQTPTHLHPKVQKTAMGATSYVPTKELPITELPRPFIALETVEGATSYAEFTFPSSPFTLFLGNEEYGLSHDILSNIDNALCIPLVGSKNSLNVACAFAIIAAQIREHYP